MSKLIRTGLGSYRVTSGEVELAIDRGLDRKWVIRNVRGMDTLKPKRVDTYKAAKQATDVLITGATPKPAEAAAVAEIAGGSKLADLFRKVADELDHAH